MAEKKKIIIVSHAMELGGAERSLLGLLESLDPQYCDIDLFLLRQEGELMEFIPSYIHLLPQKSQYTVLARPMKQTLKEGHFLLTAARCYGKFRAGSYNRIHHLESSDVALEYSHKYTYRLMPPVQPQCEYDLAISFLTPHYIAAEKVRAKKKIAWIHTDYTQISIDTVSEWKMWKKYDHIASISPSVTRGFCSKFPDLADRIIEIENILPEKLIKKQALEFDVKSEMPYEPGLSRFLSIGRYCTAKNFDNLPGICSELMSIGIKFRWYVIGYGPDENLIRERIRQFHMEDIIILLGKKENPYPYIKECDIYIQPSRYEGKSVTVREAQMLAKPVIITRYPTSGSQLQEGVDGAVVELDNKACASGIADVVRNSLMLKQLTESCKARDYSNCAETEKIYRLLDEDAV